MTATRDRSFVPALGLRSLTRFYDPLISLALREGPIKQRLIDQARIAPGMDVLDLGCGTGTLALMIKRSHPAAHVHGIDVDPEILDIARQKLALAGVDVELHPGSAADPPFAAGSFDRVLSTLVLHHLTTPEKLRTLDGVRRLLRPGGELHVADFGRPHNALMWIVSRGIRWLDGSDRTEANLTGRLPELVRQAGFVDVRDEGETMTPFGTLTFLRAAVRVEASTA